MKHKEHTDPLLEIVNNSGSLQELSERLKDYLNKLNREERKVEFIKFCLSVLYFGSLIMAVIACFSLKDMDLAAFFSILHYVSALISTKWIDREYEVSSQIDRGKEILSNVERLIINSRLENLQTKTFKKFPLSARKTAPYLRVVEGKGKKRSVGEKNSQEEKEEK